MDEEHATGRNVRHDCYVAAMAAIVLNGDAATCVIFTRLDDDAWVAREAVLLARVVGPWRADGAWWGAADGATTRPTPP